MREILYRGKAINRIEGREYQTDYKNGDWVYGLVTRLYDERFENLPATMTNTDGISGIDVDYKTIGQYTGLTDKNGTKIFEGDIVKRQWGDYPFQDVLYVVKFSFGEFELEVINTKGKRFISYLYECEIVGNIYDNPEVEMLEKEKA